MVWEEQVGGGFWSPSQKNESLEGEIVELVQSQYGINYKIATKEGEFITPSHKALQGKLRKAEVGTEVRITFLGEKPATMVGHKPTKDYRVEFNNPAPVEDIVELKLDGKPVDPQVLALAKELAAKK